VLTFELVIVYARDSDKMIFDRLSKEFEAARASQNQGGYGLLNCSSALFKRCAWIICGYIFVLGVCMLIRIFSPLLCRSMLRWGRVE